MEPITRLNNEKVKDVGDDILYPLRKLNDGSEYIQSGLWHNSSEIYLVSEPKNKDSLFFVLRQKKALKILEGIKGVPKLFFTNQAKDCIREYIDGKTLSAYAPHNNTKYDSLTDELPNTFFNDLSILVDEVHNRRIANLGLHHPSNIVLTKYFREPSLIKFDMSIHEDDEFFGWLYSLAEKADTYNLLRLKQEFKPEQITPREKYELINPIGYDDPLLISENQINLEQLLSYGRRATNCNPFLPYATILIESILNNYPKGKNILRG